MRPISGARYLVLVAAVMLAGLGALYLYVTRFSMAFLEEGYPVWLAKQNFIRSCDLGDVAIFGDSRVEAGLIAKDLPVKITILGFGGTTPIETYFAVKHALNCERLPKRVVLAHGGAQFSREPVYLWENPIRYGYISFGEARQINSAAQSLNDPSIDKIQTRDGLRGLPRDFLYASHFPAIYFNSLFSGQLFRRMDKNMTMFNRTVRLRGHIPYPPHREGRSMIGEEAILSTFKPMPTSDYFFDQTLKLLNAHHVETDWVSLPITKSSSAVLKPAVRDGFNVYLKRYAARYPNFHIVNVLPPWPDKYFSDKNHLDDVGARLFSRKLGVCMQKRIAADQMEVTAADCDWSWEN